MRGGQNTNALYKKEGLRFLLAEIEDLMNGEKAKKD